jgi:hypothetical protein
MNASGQRRFNFGSLDLFLPRGENAVGMQRRRARAKRVPTNIQGMLYTIDGQLIAPCRVRNISVSGAQIELRREAELPKTFLLSLSKNGEVVRRCITVWQLATVVGVRFEDGIYELR